MNNIISRSFTFVILVISLVMTSPITADESWSKLKGINLEQLIGEADDSTPRIASDTSGNVMALWHSKISATQFVKMAVAFSPTKGAAYGGECYINIDDHGVAGDIAYAGNGIWVCVATKEENYYHKGVFTRSFDNGRTWTSLSPLSSAVIEPAITLDSDKAGTLIASAGTALFRSTDFGETWTETPPVVPVNNTYESSPIGVNKSVVATNGLGKWVHAYLKYDGGYTNFDYYALVSTDNGITWQNVLHRDAIPYSDMRPRLEDVFVSGNDIVIAATIESKNGYYVSRNGGETWSEFIQFGEHFGDVAVAAQGTHWVILASSSSMRGPWIYSSEDLINWRSTDADVWPATKAVLTAVDGGGFAALTQVYTDIAGMTYGVTNQPVPAPDLALSFKVEPKVKTVDKQNRDIKRTVIAKISVSNLGELTSGRTLIKCLVTDFDNTPGFVEPKYITLRPIKAAKPGKKAKKRTIKMRFDCENGSPDYIFTQVMQNYHEFNPANNTAQQRLWY